jgi:hypothetical protein
MDFLSAQAEVHGFLECTGRSKPCLGPVSSLQKFTYRDWKADILEPLSLQSESMDQISVKYCPQGFPEVGKTSEKHVKNCSNPD